MDDRDLIEIIAQGMVERFGAAAVHLVRDEAENAALVSDAEIWRGIGKAIERLLTMT